MNEVQFEEPGYRRPDLEQEQSWLAGLVIKTGLASDGAGAQKVLLAVLIVVILAIIAIWTF